MVTLWPSFPHFTKFATDPRLSGIRLNSAMMSSSELDKELAIIEATPDPVPLWFDVKGRQPRVVEVHPNPKYLDITLNHPIKVQTPVPVLFKAGADGALLERVEDGGRRLIFRGGPKYIVRAGESLHIRHPSFEIQGPLFIPAELEKMTKVKTAGIKKWFLSYVEEESDVDEFLEIVGRDHEVMLKIESEKGLDYVARRFKKRPNLTLVAARGDLYVEVQRPHQIANALRLIIERDPEALVGSRILLSVVTESVPSCADFLDIAWHMDVGYRRFMLCDEMCLKDDLLTNAVNAFDAFRKDYRPITKLTPVPAPEGWWSSLTRLVGRRSQPRAKACS